ncbi:unnamed protein product [Discosporangium mesarthrocarpum]
MQRWKDAGRRVAIYSSGSCEAQRLLFSNVPSGDLCQHISAYFDTRVGHKTEEASYREIAQSLGVGDPSEIMFITDILGEAQAAQAAGLKAILSVRPGNAPLAPDHGFVTVEDFTNL